jgi:hypothetical protein
MTRSRLFLALLAILLGIVLLMALATALTLGFIALSRLFGFTHALGIDTQQSYNYDFVSGVGPMVITSLGFSGVLLGAWRHINCHTEGCLWIGRYPVGDGRFKTCRRHHPDPAVQEGVKAHHLQAAHDAHATRTARPK